MTNTKPLPGRQKRLPTALKYDREDGTFILTVQRHNFNKLKIANLEDLVLFKSKSCKRTGVGSPALHFLRAGCHSKPLYPLSPHALKN